MFDSTLTLQTKYRFIALATYYLLSLESVGLYDIQAYGIRWYAFGFTVSLSI